MDQSEVDQFISSRRARLDQEKSRLGTGPRVTGETRYPSSTEPGGPRLRTESGRMRSSHITEARRQLQKQREVELSSRESSSGGHRDRGDRNSYLRPLQDGDRYSRLKEQRLAEERRYREGVYAYGDDLEVGADDRRPRDRPRRRWDENDSPQRQQVRFDERIGRRPDPRGWDDEEQELMQWARGQKRQTGRNRNRATLTPPTYDSPEKQATHDNVRLRSISAPVVAEGIAAIGASSNSVDKRNKQREYAEELRAQIREKREMKLKEKQENQQLSPRDGLEKKPPGLSELEDRPPRNPKVREERLRPSHTGDETYPRQPRGPPRHDHPDSYDPYRQHPPPPPPRSPPSHFSSYHQYYPDYPPPLLPPPSWPSSAYHWSRPPYPPPLHYPPMDPYYPHPPGNPYLPHRPLDFADPEDRNQRRVEKDGGRRARFQVGERSEREREDASVQEWTSPLLGGVGDSQGGGGGGGKRLDKASYRAELERQMREKKEKEAETRKEREQYDVRKDAEVYDPFGKGGCGAPVRDKHGRLVTDLKMMRRRNEDKLLKTGPESPPDSPPPTATDGTSGRSSQGRGPSPRNSQEWKAKEEELKKAAMQEYRDSLKRQVEEKEAVKRREKEREKMEEQKELERLEAERTKLKEDYAREVEKQRRKEAELQAKNEALQRELEEKKRLDARKKQEEELREAEAVAEERKQALIERLEQQPSHAHRPTRSPPVPSLRPRMTHEPFSELPPTPAGPGQPEPQRSSSPPVPALRRKLEQNQLHPPPVADDPVLEERDENAPRPRVSDSPPLPAVQSKLAAGPTTTKHVPDPPPPVRNDEPLPSDEPREQAGRRDRDPDSLVKGLADLRKRLQQEDSRLAKRGGGTDTDGIFSNAVLQKPRRVAPRVRGGTTTGSTAPSSTIIRDFVAFKSSHKDILDKFPAVPQSSTDLETEQAAILRHQEQNIARLREMRQAATKANPKSATDGHTRRMERNGPSKTVGQESNGLLTSESFRAPIGGNSSGAILWDSGPGPSRRLTTDAPKPPRRQWGQPPGPPLANYPRVGSPGTQSQFSVLTGDVDSMTRGNEERARRLDAILNASSHPSAYGRGEGRDAQTILHDFLTRTNRQERPLIHSSSEQSLDCETGFLPIASETNTVT